MIGGKWTPVVLVHLKENESLRFSRIRRPMPDTPMLQAKPTS
ncbi:winged helix-turn-helix transcriptional regulator [Streptomyces sp. NBC_01716]